MNKEAHLFKGSKQNRTPELFAVFVSEHFSINNRRLATLGMCIVWANSVDLAWLSFRKQKSVLRDTSIDTNTHKKRWSYLDVCATSMEKLFKNVVSFFRWHVHVWQKL